MAFRCHRAGRFGAGLGKVVGNDLALRSLCNRIIGALADGIVRGNLQFLDVGADHDWALVGGDIPIGQTEAVDVQIAVAEVLVFLVVEGFQCGGLVGLERRDGAIKHRSPSVGDARISAKDAAVQNTTNPAQATAKVLVFAICKLPLSHYG